MLREIDRLLTINEAARRLGVHQNTLRSWADKGLVRHARLPSGHRRFTAAEVARLRREMGLDPDEGGPSQQETTEG